MTAGRGRRVIYYYLYFGVSPKLNNFALNIFKFTLFEGIYLGEKFSLLVILYQFLTFLCSLLILLYNFKFSRYLEYI